MRRREVSIPAPASSIPAVWVVSSLLAFNLALIGPHTVWSGNVNEYSASYWDVFGYLFFVALGLTFVSSLIVVSLARRERYRAVLLVFSLAALAWLEGNWRLGSVGLLDENGLDLQSLEHAGIGDAVFWIGGILTIQAFAPFLRRHVTELAAMFLSLQMVSLPVDGPRSRDARPPRALSWVPEAETFTLSSDANYILVILDTITGDTFAKLADSDPEHFDRAYAGFTLYPDTVGAFPSTQYAVPVMLGAQPYDNRVPVDDYLVRALGHDSVTRAMVEHGIVVDWVSAWPLFCREGASSSCFSIPRPYGRPSMNRLQMAAELLDISLFRHAPAFAKEWVYNAGAWRVQRLLWEESDPPIFVHSAAEFFSDWNEKIRVGRDEPTFKILHTGGGHGPFVLDAACNRIDSQPYSAPHYEIQVRCSLRQTEAFFDRLRDLGVYESAMIVVASDHGASFGANGIGSHGLSSFRLARARPLLAVKWPHAAGGLARSAAPASTQDIAPTVAAAAGLPAVYPGRDLARLAPDAVRERDYGIYVQRKGTPGGYLERVERYTVSRESRSPSAWQFVGASFSPAIDLRAARIDAGRPGSDAHFSYLGWKKPAAAQAARRVVSAVGPVATVFANLPETEPVEMSARLRVSPWALPQSIAVEVNGVAAAHWEVADSSFREYHAAIPASALGAEADAIAFRPVHHQRRGSAEPASAFDLDWIRFDRVVAR